MGEAGKKAPDMSVFDEMELPREPATAEPEPPAPPPPLPPPAAPAADAASEQQVDESKLAPDEDASQPAETEAADAASAEEARSSSDAEQEATPPPADADEARPTMPSVPPPPLPPTGGPASDGVVPPPPTPPAASEEPASATPPAETSSETAQVGGSWAEDDQITSVFGDDGKQKGPSDEEPSIVVAPEAEQVAARPAPAARKRSAPRSRAEDSRKRVIAACALVGVIAIVLVLAWPSSGSLLVTVAGPGNTVVENVKVLVDQEERCQTSPCKVDGLSEGSHIVKIEAKGYPPMATRAVTIESGKESVIDLVLKEKGAAATGRKAPASPRHRPLAQDKPEGEATTARAQLEAGKGTKKADVLVECGDDDRMLVQLPTTVEVSTDKPCMVIATRKGYREFRKKLTVDEVMAKQTFRVALAKKEKAEGGKDKEEAGGDKKEASAITGGHGTLQISSNVPSTVIVNGRPLGQTPISRKLRSGTYNVTFNHPQHGRKMVTVKVPKGGTAVASVRFP